MRPSYNSPCTMHDMEQGGGNYVDKPDHAADYTSIDWDVVLGKLPLPSQCRCCFVSACENPVWLVSIRITINRVTISPVNTSDNHYLSLWTTPEHADQAAGYPCM